ncbi:MAG TPA: hypothetical protein VGH51_11675 [Candidatus Angelobacter sp.]|jgi:hypothetical protein
MSTSSFPVTVSYRPRRVAFLVDIEDENVDKILNHILRFNLDSWGGRHNPIVPIVGGAIPSSYWTVLDTADPDIFFSYVTLGEDLIGSLHHRYSPTLITRNQSSQSEDRYKYAVGLREQAGLRNYLAKIGEKHLYRLEPRLLQLDYKEEQQLSQLFLWNFGYSSSVRNAIQENTERACKPKSSNDVDLLEMLFSERNLAWQINICGDAPVARVGGETWNREFRVFYGDSPWNVLAYWNDALVTGRTSISQGLQQLWIRPADLKNDDICKKLARLVQYFAYTGNQQKAFKFISYDTAPEELERVAKDFGSAIKFHLHYGGVSKLAPGQAEEMAPRRPRLFSSPSSTEVHYVIGTHVHLPLALPEELGRDEICMADLHIYDPGQEPGHASAEPWWCLPRKPAMAAIFNRYTAHRVTFKNEPSFEVTRDHPIVHVQLPSNLELFRVLLSSSDHYTLAEDLRASVNTMDHDGKYMVRLSDKGRYFKGILDLLGEDTGAVDLFDHPFWRSLLLRLSSSDPSENLSNKLAKDIQHSLSPLLRDSDSDAVHRWLIEELVHVGRQLPRMAPSLTFSEIQKIYAGYLGSLEEEDRQFVHDANLTERISELTKKELLFQGADLRCPHCIANLWYSVAEINKKLVCKGCQALFPLQAETTWSYRLNELVKAGIRDHGLLAVFRTLIRLGSHSEDCFFFTPSVDLNVYTEDSYKQWHEIDLAWIRDGRFGIAEVKSNTKLFKKSDYEDLAAICQSVRPDTVLIAAPEGTDADLLKGKAFLEPLVVSIGVKIRVWGPTQFNQDRSFFVLQERHGEGF